MLSIGKSARLQILKEVDFGLYLDGEHLGEILLPRQYVPSGALVDDWVNVFIYLDSEDRIIATTKKPLAELGECAYLMVVDTNSTGAFLGWGLAKDLFVPFKEQRVPMQIGKSYAVYIYEDNTQRICGSSKLDHFLNEQAAGHFSKNQAVDILIATRSDLGFRAVITNTHLGLIHNNDMLASLSIGQRAVGYIKNIRPDDSIDLALQPQGKGMKQDLSQKIMSNLEASGGISYLTDKSSPEDVFKCYGVSKGNYKIALGQLFKEKKILLEKEKITLPVQKIS